MSKSPSDHSVWSIINKLIAVILVVCAGAAPISFICGGILASLALHGPASLAQSDRAAETATPSAAAEPTEPAAVSTAISGATAGEASLAGQIAEGQKTYMAVCFACHQPTGLGLPGMFPPLAGSDWVTAPKPDRIIRNVLHGMMGPLKINGNVFNTPAPMMPPQGAALSDKQIADALTYIRNTWGNKASAVTAEQVKTIREAEKTRTTMWTEAELLNIPDR